MNSKSYQHSVIVANHKENQRGWDSGWYRPIYNTLKLRTKIKSHHGISPYVLPRFQNLALLVFLPSSLRLVTAFTAAVLSGIVGSGGPVGPELRKKSARSFVAERPPDRVSLAAARAWRRGLCALRALEETLDEMTAGCVDDLLCELPGGERGDALLAGGEVGDMVGGDFCVFD